jgi:DNA-binding LacI/PurR family transcriptional regulator
MSTVLGGVFAMEQQRRATSADVARRAGVSRATVSFVLNQRSDKRISPQTQEAVLQAARELSYQPSSAARVLRSGRSEVVMVLVPEWPPATAIDIFLAEVGNQLAVAGLACVRNYGAHWRGRLSTLWGLMSPAAVITLEPLNDADRIATENAGIPEVVSWFLDSPKGRHKTLISQMEVARLQVDYLVARGHHRLAYITSPEKIHSQFCRSRTRGFLAACRAQGLRSPTVLTLPGEPAAARTMLKACLTQPDPPTAICAYSDVVAFALLAAARQTGVSIPGDVALIGVDDLEVSAFADPPLTTVRFNLRQEAAEVTRRVCETLDVDPPEADAVAEPIVSVIARASA